MEINHKSKKQYLRECNTSEIIIYIKNKDINETTLQVAPSYSFIKEMLPNT